MSRASKIADKEHGELEATPAPGDDTPSHLELREYATGHWGWALVSTTGEAIIIDQQRHDKKSDAQAAGREATGYKFKRS